MTNAELKHQLEAQNDEELLIAPEICVWMTIYGGLRNICEVHAQYSCGKLSRSDYIKKSNELLINFVEAADFTHRFNVLLPATIEPRYRSRHRSLDGTFVRVSFSSSFWRWFNWWDDYTKSLPIYVRKHIYHLAAERVSAIEKYRPEGDWLSYRSDCPISFEA
jgi:hypothetical protein